MSELTKRGGPSDPAQQANLQLLRKFLGTLPFEYIITSGYRSLGHNMSIGGSATSQHMTGLAVDLVPHRMTNRELATWLWVRRKRYPELDQVIWYQDKGHIHIGICPRRATGCRPNAPEASFMSHLGGRYPKWQPSESEIKSVMSRFPQGKPLPWGWILGTGALLAVGGVGAYFYVKRRR
jgi:hypothetical protein